jgi:hypothetical protein
MEEHAKQAGDYLTAANILADSFRFEPESVREIGVIRQPSSAMEVQLSHSFANIHGRCAENFARAGRPQEAVREQRRAQALYSAGIGH